jgi:hypothetical protein
MGEALSGVGLYSREILLGAAAAHPEAGFDFCYRPHRYFRSWWEALPSNARRRLLAEPWGPRSAGLFHGLNQRLPRFPMRRAVATFHDLFVMTGEYSTPEFRLRFTAQARDAAARADLVIATGGLGPTSDDLTRDCAARLLGRPLVLHPHTLAWIEQYFASRKRRMPASARVQAMVPEGATVLPNPNGTAPGLALRAGDSEAFHDHRTLGRDRPIGGRMPDRLRRRGQRERRMVCGKRGGRRRIPGQADAGRSHEHQRRDCWGQGICCFHSCREHIRDAASCSPFIAIDMTFIAKCQFKMVNGERRATGVVTAVEHAIGGKLVHRRPKTSKSDK